jgi:hypothetical protein
VPNRGQQVSDSSLILAKRGEGAFSRNGACTCDMHCCLKSRRHLSASYVGWLGRTANLPHRSDTAWGYSLSTMPNLFTYALP